MSVHTESAFESSIEAHLLAHGWSPLAPAAYNRRYGLFPGELDAVRQLHHSESRPGDSLDLVRVVNGIPTASAELKNPLTQQTAEHAMTQYRTDRNPTESYDEFRADATA